MFVFFNDTTRTERYVNRPSLDVLTLDLKEGYILFKDALNTFDLLILMRRSYGKRATLSD